MQITITQDLADSEIANLLDEASRGAAYWCHGAQQLGYESVCNEIIAGTAMLTLLDKESGKQHFFDAQNLKAGLKIMAEKWPKHWADFVKKNDDDVTGDLFLQCALLGDVLYD